MFINSCWYLAKSTFLENGKTVRRYPHSYFFFFFLPGLHKLIIRERLIHCPQVVHNPNALPPEHIYFQLKYSFLLKYAASESPSLLKQGNKKSLCKSGGRGWLTPNPSTWKGDKSVFILFTSYSIAREDFTSFSLSFQQEHLCYSLRF